MFNLVTGTTLLAASVLAGYLWKTQGPTSTFARRGDLCRAIVDRLCSSRSSPRTAFDPLIHLSPRSSRAMTEKSLYEQIGGYDGIVAVVNDLLPVCGDDQLGRFWQHRGEGRHSPRKQLLIDFLAHCTGGPLLHRP